MYVALYDWHCQRQKTSVILLASDFVMWTAQYILDLISCFSYTDYKFICYLLLVLITFHNFTVNINIYQVDIQFIKNQVDTSIMILCIILVFGLVLVWYFQCEI